MIKYFILLFMLILNFNNLLSQNMWQKVSPFNGIPVKTKCLDSLNCVTLSDSAGYCTLYHSRNGGYNWDIILKHTGDTHLMPFDFAYPDTNHICILYDGNLIIKYNSQGIAWDTLKIDIGYLPAASAIRSREIMMTDTLTGLLCIEDRLVLTTDGWKTYKIFIPDPVNHIEINVINIQNKDNFSFADVKNNYNNTTDGGQNFTKIPFGCKITDIYFLNENIGYIKGSVAYETTPRTGKEMLFKTTDKGQSWKKVIDSVIDNFYFGVSQIEINNENFGMFVSERGVIILTSNGFKKFNREYIFGVEDNCAFLSMALSGSRPIVAAEDVGIFIRNFSLSPDAGTPVLINPPDKSTKNPTEIDFKWSKIPNIHSYIFQLAYDANFDNIIRNDTVESGNIANLELYNVTGLKNCQEYYWRVAAFDGINAKWAIPFSFSTKLEQAIQIYPEDQSENISINTFFRWNELDGNEKYLLQIALDKNFDDLIFSQDILQTNQFKYEFLPAFSNIYWRLRGYCLDGYGDWSEIHTFKTNSTVSVLEQSHQIRFYPNPAEDFLEIQNDNNISNLNIQIFNILGIEIYNLSESSGNAKIDISLFPAGVYFIRIGNIIQKFVKM